MTKASLNILLPQINKIAELYTFVSHDVHRKNIAITLQYIMLMIEIESNYELPDTTATTIYKDIIIHTACILELILLDKITIYLESGKLNEKDIKLESVKFKSFTRICTSEDGEEVGHVIRKSKEVTPRDLQFKQLNSVALKAGILTNTLYAKSEEIRKLRNKIHLSTLENPDNEYSKDLVDDTFESVRKIKRRLLVV